MPKSTVANIKEGLLNALSKVKLSRERTVELELSSEEKLNPHAKAALIESADSWHKACAFQVAGLQRKISDGLLIDNALKMVLEEQKEYLETVGKELKEVKSELEANNPAAVARLHKAIEKANKFGMNLNETTQEKIEELRNIYRQRPKASLEQKTYQYLDSKSLQRNKLEQKMFEYLDSRPKINLERKIKLAISSVMHENSELTLKQVLYVVQQRLRSEGQELSIRSIKEHAKAGHPSRMKKLLDTIQPGWFDEPDYQPSETKNLDSKQSPSSSTTEDPSKNILSR